MKFGNSNNFEQSYNLQAAVDTDSKMIVGTYPTQKCNDKAELKNCVESVPEELEKEENVFVCADTGYFSSSLIENTEEGQKIYSKRKTTVELVFGIIKRVMGFRQFLM